jgi:hypothetical protein
VKKCHKVMETPPEVKLNLIKFKKHGNIDIHAFLVGKDLRKLISLLEVEVT